jgi:hypothetical protein
MSIKLIASSFVASFLLLGCGGGGSDSTTAVTTIDGQLVDNYVENVDYVCGNSLTAHLTDRDGRFSCESLPVSFSLGGLRLGSVDTLQSDKQVFPQDLLKVARADTNNTEVLAMARFLQSCDSDTNLSTGINIADETKTKLEVYDEDFDSTHIDNYAQDANVTLVDEEASQEHLEDTVNFVDAVNAVTSLPQNVKDELLTAESVLTQDLKDTLSYMQNEERLAFDVYNELYKLFPTANQLNNIATNSESVHIQTVELLILKYINSVDEFSNLDLNTDLSQTTAGEYSISAIKDLYDALMSIGDDSKQAALEVGCMIEVTDINDLDGDIALAQASNATDVEAAFVYLRNGSYNHYWAFDSGLKGIGVTEGCCSLGTVDGVDYCQNYPK